MTKKTTQLKTLLYDKSLSFLMEAHNGLSSKIVEETGFKGIWASGLSISASLGVRDNNEASWTQIIDVLEFMSDATNIPILLDGDTGYGNFNNVRRLIQKLEQRDVAGVCIEDKLFPKTNSFINGESQPLADLGEFCGKIKAAKDTQSDPDFCLVARIEAFIAELGLEEALKRAEAYSDSGADAILVHSKKSTAEEIISFMTHWKKETPIIIVPTKYYSTPTTLFEEIGISTVIWANHNVRSSIKAMQETTQRIFNDHHLRNVEENIVTVSEVFRIQGAEELSLAEKHYLPDQKETYAAIILCAGGSDLGQLTETMPKSMLTLHGKSILEHQIDTYAKYQIHDITAIRGHHKSAINLPNLNTIDNDDYAKTGEVYSLSLAKDLFEKNTLLSYGDIIFKDYFVHECLDADADIAIVVDANCPKGEKKRDYIEASSPYNPIHFSDSAQLKIMNRQMDNTLIHGEFIGLLKWSEQGGKQIKETLDSIPIDTLKTYSIQDFFNLLIKTYDVHIIYVENGWVDVNSIHDYVEASDFYA